MEGRIAEPGGSVPTWDERARPSDRPHRRKVGSDPSLPARPCGEGGPSRRNKKSEPRKRLREQREVIPLARFASGPSASATHVVSGNAEDLWLGSLDGRVALLQLGPMSANSLLKVFWADTPDGAHWVQASVSELFDLGSSGSIRRLSVPMALGTRVRLEVRVETTDLNAAWAEFGVTVAGDLRTQPEPTFEHQAPTPHWIGGSKLMEDVRFPKDPEARFHARMALLQRTERKLHHLVEWGCPPEELGIDRGVSPQTGEPIWRRWELVEIEEEPKCQCGACSAPRAKDCACQGQSRDGGRACGCGGAKGMAEADEGGTKRADGCAGLAGGGAKVRTKTWRPVLLSTPELARAGEEGRTLWPIGKTAPGWTPEWTCWKQAWSTLSTQFPQLVGSGRRLPFSLVRLIAHGVTPEDLRITGETPPLRSRQRGRCGPDFYGFESFKRGDDDDERPRRPDTCGLRKGDGRTGGTPLAAAGGPGTEMPAGITTGGPTDAQQCFEGRWDYTEALRTGALGQYTSGGFWDLAGGPARSDDGNWAMYLGFKLKQRGFRACWDNRYTTGVGVAFTGRRYARRITYETALLTDCFPESLSNAFKAMTGARPWIGDWMRTKIDRFGLRVGCAVGTTVAGDSCEYHLSASEPFAESSSAFANECGDMYWCPRVWRERRSGRVASHRSIPIHEALHIAGRGTALGNDSYALPCGPVCGNDGISGNPWERNVFGAQFDHWLNDWYAAQWATNVHACWVPCEFPFQCVRRRAQRPDDDGIGLVGASGGACGHLFATRMLKKPEDKSRTNIWDGYHEDKGGLACSDITTQMARTTEYGRRYYRLRNEGSEFGGETIAWNYWHDAWSGP